MNQDKSTQTLLMYVNDVLALERLIKEAVASQSNEDNVCADYETMTLMNTIVTCSETRRSDLEELSESLGGGAGALKESVAVVSGVFTGLYDMARKHPVSRMLRDDYTALALLSTAYSMLYTTAVALNNVQVAAIARHGLFNVAPLISEISQMIPAVVVGELAINHSDINYGAINGARQVRADAWLPESELVYE